MMRKKAIICDFGGILGTDADTVFNEVLAAHGISIDEIKALWNEFWPRLKLGKIRADLVWKAIQRRYEGKVDVRKLEQEYNAKISIYREVLDYFKSFKNKEIKLIILANESLDWMDIKIKKGKLEQVFDKIYSSAILGIAKPQREAYARVIRELGLDKKEVLFIDNLKRNVNAAEDMGIKSILYTNLEDLKKELPKILQLA